MKQVFKAGNVKTVRAARRKRHRRRGRFIHRLDDSFITKRFLDQLTDEVIYQDALEKKLDEDS
ncbi:hypothetical protein [Pluralibacter gergoviae]|uniref:hypothetical protein n=1 Tax=Pluralibacter gergoviae TaxID=61647 RepID=UPI002ED94A9F